METIEISFTEKEYSQIERALLINGKSIVEWLKEIAKNESHMELFQDFLKRHYHSVGKRVPEWQDLIPIWHADQLEQISNRPTSAAS